MHKQKIITSIMLMSCMVPSILGNWWFEIRSLQDVLDIRPDISYLKCFDTIPFEFERSPFYMGDAYHPYKGTFAPTFILKIPQGQIFSSYGWVIIDNSMIREMVWKDMFCHLNGVENEPSRVPVNIHGRVVSIAQPAYFNYYHWLSELLGRLALVEMFGVEYDFVYAPYHMQYMKDTLDLWGIDRSSIIPAGGVTHHIQADELILPSLVSNVNFGLVMFSCYPQRHILPYVRDKLLKGALARSIDKKFSKRIFISRKDSPQRHVLNEDAVFALFEKYGFERYELSKFSVTEQIHLFHNAEIVVSAQGTGPTNSMFCKPGTPLVELIQRLNDTTMFFLSQIFNLDYMGIPTAEFTTNWYEAYADTTMSLELIQMVIDSLHLDPQSA